MIDSTSIMEALMVHTGDPDELFGLGDMTIGGGWIRTPYGVLPLAGSTWSVVEHEWTAREIPTWAVATAVLLTLLCLVGLLFLTVRRDVTHRDFLVTVEAGGHVHTTVVGTRTLLEAVDTRAAFRRAEALAALV